MGKGFRIIRKTILYLLGTILILAIAIVLFIQTEYSKRIIRDRVQAYLQTKLKTKVAIGAIDFRIPKWIVVDSFYLEDQQRRSLASGSVAVDLDMLQLISGNVIINKVSLNNIAAHISRPANDSTFNYQFLIDAFAAKTPAPAVKKDTAAMKITLKELSLRGLAINYDDQYNGSSFSANVVSADALFNQFRLDQMQFGLEKVRADGVDFNMDIFGVSKTPEAPKSAHPLRALITAADAINVSVRLRNKINGMIYSSQIKQLGVRNAEADMGKSLVAAASFVLDSSSIKYVGAKTIKPVLNVEKEGAATGSDWKFKLDTVSLRDDHIQYGDMPDAYIGRLNASIVGDLQALQIPVLQFTGLSGVQLNAKAALLNATDVNHLHYDVAVLNSVIPRADMLRYLPPAQAKTLADKIPAFLRLAAHIQGSLSDVSASFRIAVPDFRIAGDAAIRHFNNTRLLQYEANIKDAVAEKSFIVAMAPKTAIPASIRLPQIITLSGKIRGDLNNVSPDLKLGGSYGGFIVKGLIHDFRRPEAASYDLHFTADHFEAGKLLKRDTVIGALSFSAAAKGRGFNYKTMRADMELDVQRAEYKQYPYQNIVMSASFRDGNVTAEGTSGDPNVRMQFKALANVSAAYPTGVEATLTLDTVQLQSLHLYKDTLNASTRIYLKAENLDPQTLKVYAVADTSLVFFQNKHYALDTIVFSARDSGKINTAGLRSPIADLDAVGAFDYAHIGGALTAYLNRFYKIANSAYSSGRVVASIPPQQMVFKGTVKNPGLITAMFPGLSYDSFHFNGAFSSDDQHNALTLKSAIPHIAYGTNRFAGGQIDVGAANDQVTGLIRFDTLASGTNMFYAAAVTARLAGDSILLRAVAQDAREKDQYALGAAVLRQNKTYVVSLKDSLKLNYENWTVSPGNRIEYAPEGVLVQNFGISNRAGSISANSKTAVLNSPIDVHIEHFNIKNVAALLNRDTLLASGVLQGTFTVSEFTKKIPAFTGALNLSQLVFMQQPVGDIQLAANKTDDNTIHATIGLAGDGNKMDVQADYFLNNDAKQVDAVAHIRQLRMATLQAFSKGQLEKSAGAVTGSVAVSGKFSDLRWKGALEIDTAHFTVAQIGTPYYIDRQKITLDYPAISFDQFTVKDSAGQTLILNGQATAASAGAPGLFDLALNLKASNFAVIDAPQGSNNLAYGYAALRGNLSVKGTSAAPDIEGNVSFTDKTNLTVIRPEPNVQKDAALSSVRFIRRDTFPLPEKLPFSPAKEVKPSVSQSLNYNLNIEVPKSASLTIVIDPSTGDELKVQGDAQLNAGVDPGGNIVLAGNYELNGGHYLLTYEFLSRNFDLLPGGTIAFSGSPMDAEINMSAVYVVNTSPKELLANEVGSVDPQVANTFNQKIPFRVVLTMKGPLKKPEISFNVELPGESSQISSQLRTTVENKLLQLRSDVASTNKQVFSLLVLSRFSGEQSADFFSGGGSTDFTDLARESVSRFLSSALDKIANNLIKGVEVNVNLVAYKDYSGVDPQRKTDLNIALTKRFLDDRLSVSVGNNFGIEGGDPSAKAAQQKGNSFSPDVSIGYKLSKDGRYMIKAYNKNQYEEILDGYVVETGVAFLISIDYDKIKELFIKKSKRPQ